MGKELKGELLRITRVQSFRRDHQLIPNTNYQLDRINKQLKEFSERNSEVKND